MTRDGLTDPWRMVTSTRIQSMWQHGVRRIRWHLILECGHDDTRSVEGLRGPGWQEAAAPRKVRCRACTDEIARKVLS